MTEDRPEAPATLALSTKVEEDFLMPLTAIRGAVEILRDNPDLDFDQRRRFVDVALKACARLENGVHDLSKAVYSAARESTTPEPAAAADDPELRDTLRFDDANETVELDLHNEIFRASADVVRFFDAVERAVKKTERSWYFLINQGDCQVWPEAWVAFAHRAKRLYAASSLGTVKFIERGADEPPNADPEILGSQDEARAAIARLRQGAG